MRLWESTSVRQITNINWSSYIFVQFSKRSCLRAVISVTQTSHNVSKSDSNLCLRLHLFKVQGGWFTFLYDLWTKHDKTHPFLWTIFIDLIKHPLHLLASQHHMLEFNWSRVSWLVFCCQNVGGKRMNHLASNSKLPPRLQIHLAVLVKSQGDSQRGECVMFLIVNFQLDNHGPFVNSLILQLYFWEKKHPWRDKFTGRNFGWS